MVRSGNWVRTDHGDDLVRSLDALAACDKAGLKALYKERLHRESVPGQGAGLGLIDMARRTTAPLDYALKPEGDGYAFFSLQVVI